MASGVDDLKKEVIKLALRSLVLDIRDRQPLINVMEKITITEKFNIFITENGVDWNIQL